MQRRKFLQASLATSAALATACTTPSAKIPTGVNAITQAAVEWIMVTTWPPGFPILQAACQRLADYMSAMSDGRFVIKVYGSGELIPAFECFEAVTLGTAAIASGASYYWAGKIPEAQFFSSVPFGLNAQGMNAWIDHAGGLELWRKAYAPFNIRPYAGGNTGVQMAGWFNRELNDLQSFRGLKMRIPGLGGKVFERAGGTTLLSPGTELYTNLERGVLDATEWIGPYHDYLMGFHEVAEYYYGPGWHEPGTVLEIMVHEPTYATLPLSYQTMLDAAIASVNAWTLHAFEAQNGEYLQKITAYGTQVRTLPKAVIDGLRPLAQDVVQELADTNPQAATIYESYAAFARTYGGWVSLSEGAYQRLLR